jgi:hypothetical protein
MPNSLYIAYNQKSCTRCSYPRFDFRENCTQKSVAALGMKSRQTPAAVLLSHAFLRIQNTEISNRGSHRCLIVAQLWLSACQASTSRCGLFCQSISSVFSGSLGKGWRNVRIWPFHLCETIRLALENSCLKFETNLPAHIEGRLKTVC